MERKNRYDGLHPAAVSTIRYQARKLRLQNAVAGMEVEDYEQHLALQLFRRSDRYDDRRASFATFADRVVRSQSATLARTTETRSHECETLSLDDPLPCSDGDGTLQNLVSEERAWLSDAADLRVDLSRFIGSLPLTLRRCVGWIAAGGAQAAVRDGLHRSCFYEARERLRARAMAYGLGEYL